MPDLTFPLQTERLDLRPFEEGDLGDVRELYGDAQVHRYLYSEAMDEQALREQLARKMSYRVLDKEGDGLALLAVLRETGQAVGDAALIWVSQEHQTSEIGYVIKPDQRGHGYATEMAAAMMQLGFETLDLHLGQRVRLCPARHRVVGRAIGCGQRRDHLGTPGVVSAAWSPPGSSSPRWAAASHLR